MQQAALYRRERQVGEVNVVLWFVCVNLRDQRETSGVSFVWIDRVLLHEYSPADNADNAERNAAGCIITQRKTVCLRLRLFCCFGLRLRKSARSAGDIGVFMCILIE